jgi:hypothetical protein
MSYTRARLRHRLVPALALGAILAAMSFSIAFAADGNNGTVKVHEGATDSERIVSEDSHVCTFHVHFFFADAGQTGDWSIDESPPTGQTASVIFGSYITGANGEYQTVEYGLPVGHYKLSWEGRNEQNVKHKSFWVTCPNLPGPISGG